MTYVAPLKDMLFVLNELADLADVHALPGGDLFNFSGFGGIVGIAADPDGDDPGGKRQFGIGGGEGNNTRRGHKPRRCQQKQRHKRSDERLSHAPVSVPASQPSGWTA